ncbi:succinyl-CoA--3-ketoacid-CoA transferase [Pradoshia eiseniae]|uniref:Succinyl-CoA--3-ketoacid-CoA transferase n=1 Tax=Pradoshia eiseniae TaxID=2064768 RepID=A0A2S7MXG5_9BACI|nr:3-oxoacid CoA-transferase subunit B [Pradoshia eiseniae]PQD94460.1 succinyl-CoA--3-ketoacid-CoA transferase [Pradoshia eiseniae]
MKNKTYEMIAKRAAMALAGSRIVNLGIGIPTLVADYLDDDAVCLHTENGLLGVTKVDADQIDPNLVNAGKLPVGEGIGSSFFHSADSFGMIRGGHVDVAVLGALQVDQCGRIANWAVPGQSILGVGGAMDLLAGAKSVIVTMTHTAKNGASKLVKECNYPLSGRRNADLIITDLAVFAVKEESLHLIELMPDVDLEHVQNKTEADFTVDLAGD